jgi:hypothetical protein
MLLLRLLMLLLLLLLLLGTEGCASWACLPCCCR